MSQGQLIESVSKYFPKVDIQTSHTKNTPALPQEPKVTARIEQLDYTNPTNGDVVVTASVTWKGVGLWMSDYERSYANVRFYWKKQRYSIQDPKPIKSVHEMWKILTLRQFAPPHATTRHMVTVPGTTLTKVVKLKVGQSLRLSAGASAELDASTPIPPARDRHTLRHFHGIQIAYTVHIGS